MHAYVSFFRSTQKRWSLRTSSRSPVNLSRISGSHQTAAFDSRRGWYARDMPRQSSKATSGAGSMNGSRHTEGGSSAAMHDDDIARLIGRLQAQLEALLWSALDAVTHDQARQFHQRLMQAWRDVRSPDAGVREAAERYLDGLKGAIVFVPRP